MRVTVERLPGVEQADVSLNEGEVTIDFAPENAVTVAEIRAAIRAQGFSPQEAKVRITGTVEEQSGAVLLAAPGQTFILSPSSEAARLRERAGEQVTLDGKIGQDVDDTTPPRLEVTSGSGGD